MKNVAVIAKNLEINGITNVIMNYYLGLSKKKYNITIFAGIQINEDYKKKLTESGISICELPSKKNPILYYKQLFKVLKNKKFDIAHVHGNTENMGIDLMICKLNGIKIRIAHCHNDKTKKVNWFLKLLFKKSYTYCIACSEKAGNWIFNNNNFVVLNNGFEIENFKFDSKAREEIRKKLNINENNILIGHTGRLNDQKNQDFLIDLLEKLNDSKYYLILIGNGPNYDKIYNKVQKSVCKNNIILYGESTNIAKMYSAMDIFCYPSLYEGLGISLLEAQINGLICIASNKVPIESKITENVEYISTDNELLWKEKIKRYSNSLKNREININESKIQKYNIANCVEKLDYIYESLCKNIN